MQDKVVVVVGATGGIGSALTHKLAPTGVRLVLAARDAVRLTT
ncbi:MAG: oxidoreductase, partial [Nostoc sp.]